jgi:hypothetical protein
MRIRRGDAARGSRGAAIFLHPSPLPSAVIFGPAEIRSAGKRGKSRGEARFVDAGADRVRREAPQVPQLRLSREAWSAPAPREAPGLLPLLPRLAASLSKPRQASRSDEQRMTIRYISKWRLPDSDQYRPTFALPALWIGIAVPLYYYGVAVGHIRNVVYRLLNHFGLFVQVTS